MNIYYAGIGSRNTPDEVLKIMKNIAYNLAISNVILRSGGAIGADKAFESGCNLLVGSNKEIFTVNEQGYFITNNRGKSDLKKFSEDVNQYFIKYHPFPNKISNQYIKNLLKRNTFQVLGESLKSPSKFVICWTPDGCEECSNRTKISGGTGQAISISSEHGIPVFNLANNNAIERMNKYLIDNSIIKNNTDILKISKIID